MSGGAHGPMEQVSLRCQVCGSVDVIWRRKCRLKEKGHVKHLWCFECQERTAHVEIKEETWN